MFVRLLHEKKPDLMEFAGAWKMRRGGERPGIVDEGIPAPL